MFELIIPAVENFGLSVILRSICVNLGLTVLDSSVTSSCSSVVWSWQFGIVVFPYHTPLLFGGVRIENIQNC